MQLPRGKFRSVIKGVALNSLIQELAEVRYTGFVAISLKQGAVSLVIQRGRYILAEFGPLRGDAAWEGVTALGEITVDAILSDFSEPELKLSLEFNEASLLSAQALLRVPKAPRGRVTRSAPPEVSREKARERPPRELPPVTPATPPSPPPSGPPPVAGEGPAMGPVSQKETPVPPNTWTKVDMSQAIGMPKDQAGSGVPLTGDYDELALLRMEMSALDDVDVEHIATKIRKNAKGIVKKLHLGHLMTEKEE